MDNISGLPVEQGRADQQDHAATVPLVHNERPSTRISCGAGTAARTRTSNQTVMSGRKPRTLSKNRAFSMIFMHRLEQRSQQRRAVVRCLQRGKVDYACASERWPRPFIG